MIDRFFYMLSGFCPDSFGVLFRGVVFGCRYTPETTGPSSQLFLTWGVVECDIAHRRSVVVLYMLYKIRCNPMHPFNGALPGPFVPVRVTRRALGAHHYTDVPPRCSTSQYHKTFISLSVSLWNDLADPVFDGVGLAGFKSRANPILFP